MSAWYKITPECSLSQQTLRWESWHGLSRCTGSEGCNQAAAQDDRLISKPTHVAVRGLSFSRKAYGTAGDFTQSRDHRRGHHRCRVSSCSHGKSIWLGANVVASSLWSHLRLLEASSQNLVITTVLPTYWLQHCERHRASYEQTSSKNICIAISHIKQKKRL